MELKKTEQEEKTSSHNEAKGAMGGTAQNKRKVLTLMKWHYLIDFWSVARRNEAVHRDTHTTTASAVVTTTAAAAAAAPTAAATAATAAATAAADVFRMFLFRRRCLHSNTPINDGVVQAKREGQWNS